MFATYARFYWPWIPLLYSVIALGWSGLWLVSSAETLAPLMALDQVIPELLYWNAWGLATPLVWMRVQRDGAALRSPSWRWGLHLLLAVMASALVYLLSLGLYGAIYVAGEVLGVGWPLPLADKLHAGLAMLVSFRVPFGCIVYAVIAGFALAADYVRRLRRAEERAMLLRAQLAEANLNALKMQLQPHFLFNTLNTISSSLQDDPRTADDMLARLGGFLRRTLDHADRDRVPLWEEVAFCRQYLSIEQDRFEDRLRLSFFVDPAIRDAAVPHLLLQPLAENAMRHGVALHSGPGRIAVDCRQDAEHVLVEIRNTAPTSSDRAEPSERGGLGLANTRARLEQAFDGATLAFDATDGDVRVRLRFRYTPYAEVRDCQDVHRIPMSEPA